MVRLSTVENDAIVSLDFTKKMAFPDDLLSVLNPDLDDDEAVALRDNYLQIAMFSPDTQSFNDNLTGWIALSFS